MRYFALRQNLLLQRILITLEINYFLVGANYVWKLRYNYVEFWSIILVFIILIFCYARTKLVFFCCNNILFILLRLCFLCSVWTTHGYNVITTFLYFSSWRSICVTITLFISSMYLRLFMTLVLSYVLLTSDYIWTLPFKNVIF